VWRRARGRASRPEVGPCWRALEPQRTPPRASGAARDYGQRPIRIRSDRHTKRSLVLPKRSSAPTSWRRVRRHGQAVVSAHRAHGESDSGLMPRRRQRLRRGGPDRSLERGRSALSGHAAAAARLGLVHGRRHGGRFCVCCHCLSRKARPERRRVLCGRCVEWHSRFGGAKSLLRYSRAFTECTASGISFRLAAPVDGGAMRDPEFGGKLAQIAEYRRHTGRS
jgi:hypothetical protein